MAATAQAAAAPINAVLFGALIGSGALPISRQSAEDAIRQAQKAVEPNLRGFAAGFDGAHGRATLAPADAPSRTRARVSADDLIASARATLPAAAHDVVALGIERLVDYQGPAYADLFVQRLLPVARIEERARGADFAVTRETARLLALWMSYEDVIRVADLKTRADRLARVREEVRAHDGDIVHITEFLKPGIDELCSILPPRLGLALLRRARERGLEDRLNVGMYIRSTGVFGFLLLRLLASFRWWRPHSLRYQDEQALIERWLDAVARAAAVDLVLAREIAECAQLVKGYGDTHRRGVANFTLIEQAYFKDEGAASPVATLAIRRAREAALADPEGDALQAALAKPVTPPSPPSPSPQAAAVTH
jgi:indolepyruvate ferredoxin oxidoreductase beta subunit